jgi:hypothetical protein
MNQKGGWCQKYGYSKVQGHFTNPSWAKEDQEWEKRVVMEMKKD